MGMLGDSRPTGMLAESSQRADQESAAGPSHRTAVVRLRESYETVTKPVKINLSEIESEMEFG